jgi:histidine triad (HIT) family protein
MVRGEENEPWSGQGDVVYRDPKTTAWVNGRWWEANPGAVVVVPNAHVENIYAIDRQLAGDIHEKRRSGSRSP